MKCNTSTVPLKQKEEEEQGLSLTPIIPEFIDETKNVFHTIDSHTMGESTRIIYDGGFPKTIPGSSMMEKKQYVESHLDHLREALILEPRGHGDMFGALLTTPVSKEADIGVIFMDSGGYLNMCGHGSIGVASMAVDTKMVEVKEPYTEVSLDTPSGVIKSKVLVKDGKAIEASIVNVPSFVFKEGAKIEDKEYGEIEYDISFGGSFFALVNADKIGLKLKIDNISEITDLGMRLREKINKEQKVEHPYLDITEVDLVEFYTHDSKKEADNKNCVIFGNSQADRSPCGTGTSAKLASLYSKKEIGLNEDFVYESITGSTFKGKILSETTLDDGKIKSIIPQITGSAYITGMNQWIIDKKDPLKYGFLLT